MAKKAPPSTTAAKPPAAKASASSKPASKRAGAKDAEVTPTPVAAKSPKPTVVTLKQLAVQLGESQQVPTKQAQAMLDDIVGIVVDHLKAGGKLRLNGLGILEVKDRPARTGRNPATGEAVQIAASKKVAFRPAKELKDAI